MAAQQNLTPAQLQESVAQHMQRVPATLRPEQTVAEALTSLHDAELSEKIVYFYVVGEHDRLLGVVPTRRLLTGGFDQRIGDLMVPAVVSIPHDASLIEAAEYFVTRKLLALPVVDDQLRLLGVVDVTLFTTDMVNLTEQEAIGDVFQLIGIHVQDGRHDRTWVGFRDRFPWLLVNVGGGLLCALVASRFEALLDQVVVLALFIPLVLTLCESVSIQSMTLTLQTFHRRGAGTPPLWRALGRELLQALLLGSGCGLVVGVVGWLWRGDFDVAAATMLSITLAMMTACLLGVALPTAVHRLNRDPNLAAGPVVLATADVCALLIYFNLAGLLLTP